MNIIWGSLFWIFLKMIIWENMNMDIWEYVIWNNVVPNRRRSFVANDAFDFFNFSHASRPDISWLAFSICSPILIIVNDAVPLTVVGRQTGLATICVGMRANFWVKKGPTFDNPIVSIFLALFFGPLLIDSFRGENWLVSPWRLQLDSLRLGTGNCLKLGTGNCLKVGTGNCFKLGDREGPNHISKGLRS